MVDSPKEESSALTRGGAAPTTERVPVTSWYPSQEHQLETDQDGEPGAGRGAGLGPQPCSLEELMKGMGSGMACNRKTGLGRREGLEGRVTREQLLPAV